MISVKVIEEYYANHLEVSVNEWLREREINKRDQDALYEDIQYAVANYQSADHYGHITHGHVFTAFITFSHE